MMTKFKIHIIFLAFLTILTLLLSAKVFAQTPISTQSLIQELQKQIQQLQAQVAELKTQLETSKQEITEIKAELKISRSLRLGVTGDDVRELQEFLKQFPDIYPQGLVTGYFGPLTEIAVRKFQSKQGIDSIGVVGPKTLSKLNELITEGAGKSEVIPQGLLIAPGVQKKLEPIATTTTPIIPITPATTTPPSSASTPSTSTTTPTGTTPATPATSATPATPTSVSGAPTVSAIPATPAVPVATATSTTTASTTPTTTTPPATTTGDTTPPSVTITGPVAASPGSFCTVKLGYVISDNSGSTITFQIKINGVNYGPEHSNAAIQNSTFSGGNCYNLANGSHTYTVVAWDAAGNITTNSTTFSLPLTTADTTPPTITITSPLNGARVSGFVTISANVSDNVGVVGVQFAVGPVNAGPEVIAEPYSISWNSLALSDGQYIVFASARDAAGNRNAVGPITISVVNSTTSTPTYLRTKNLSAISQMLNSLDEILKQLSQLLK